MPDATAFARALPEPQVREHRAAAMPGLPVFAAAIALTGAGLWQTLAAIKASASVALAIALATLAPRRPGRPALEAPPVQRRP